MRLELSDRERQVIAFAAHGLSDKEIAKRCKVTVSTIRTYWDRIREKSGAVTRTHAVCLVLSLAMTTELSEMIQSVGAECDQEQSSRGE
jgi:DNA-binding NarL/FixJ family response regulator